MNRIYFFLIAGFYMCTVLSCNKSSSNTTPPADVPGSVQIDHPVANAIYTNGSPILIDGTMTDNNNLVSAKVEVKNKTTSATLYQQTTNTGNVTFYRFSWTYTLSGITTLTPGTVKVTAKDNLGNEVYKEVDITFDN